MSRRAGTPEPKIFGKTILLSVSYLVLALACLIQWHPGNAWSRLDVFSGSYLALRAIGNIHSILSSRRAFESHKLRSEWWGTTSNPRGIPWVVLLMLGDLLVFFDYGHWHTLPSLELPVLQSAGLGVYGCTTVWQVWTDKCLARYFASQSATRTPIGDGPFRYIRHPRYTGAMAGKIAFALVFASVFGWVLGFVWLSYLSRVVVIEEAHLKKLFGEQYEIYKQRTARVLPGVY